MARSQDAALDRKVSPNHAFLGREYGREPDGTYLQNWNPLMLARELRPGEIVGKDFLGTRVIIYRGPDARPVVQSAYCPHVGADLSLGKLVDGNVRCAYHHWKFAADGRCVAIPEADRIPTSTCIYNYPAEERWGLIWAFNCEKPLYGLPEMPNVAAEDLIYEVDRHGLRPVEGFISSSNVVDFQHLKTVHGIANPIPKTIVFEDFVVKVHQEAPDRVADSHLYGATWLGIHLQYLNTDMPERFFMAGSSQVAPGISDAFYLVAMRRREAEKIGEEAARQRLQQQIAYVKKLYSEDEPILFSMRFRGRGKSKLIGIDQHFARFLQYVDSYPRAKPFDV
jgi:nitrite reductase/ring-hydroxylating ferredoxin subunit